MIAIRSTSPKKVISTASSAWRSRPGSRRSRPTGPRSLTAARAFGLFDRGMIAPGCRADIVLIDALESCRVSTVISAGRVVDEALFAARTTIPPIGLDSMKARRVTAQDFAVPGSGLAVPVIGVVPGRIITEHLRLDLPSREGSVGPDASQDVAKVCVVERHGRNGNIGRGFVKGFGMRRGAIASSIGHDSHNICVVGADDADMALAANHLATIRGGFAVVEGGRVLADLPLPVAGTDERPVSRGGTRGTSAAAGRGPEPRRDPGRALPPSGFPALARDPTSQDQRPRHGGCRPYGTDRMTGRGLMDMTR